MYDHTEWEYWEYAECIGGIMTEYLQDKDVYVEYSSAGLDKMLTLLFFCEKNT